VILAPPINPLHPMTGWLVFLTAGWLLMGLPLIIATRNLP
jgi:hypothetical protein